MSLSYLREYLRKVTNYLMCLLCLLPMQGMAQGVTQADEFEGDPYKSYAWRDMKNAYLSPDARVQFDERVKVQGPGFAEDSMNVPISVSAPDIKDVHKVVVMVDRNPIKKVLEYYPVSALPSVSFRFKLEQGSPVRAAMQTKDGVWHVGGVWVDASGGGCTVAGDSRKDGSWSSTLGQVSGRMYTQVNGEVASRLRVRVMHPMDTGLVGGIPAFYVNKLTVRDADGVELARLHGFEPLSENPVLSFDFISPPKAPLSIVGGDNNGNRIDSKVTVNQ
jgi:sulfur-oxidizing protein SoxY